MKMRLLIGGFVLSLFGCSVDLSRDEAFLSVLIEGAPPVATKAFLRLSHPEDDLVYEQDKLLSPEGEIQTVPTLSLPAGAVFLELDLVDAENNRLDMLMRRELVLRAEHTTRARISYRGELVLDPVSGQTIEVPPQGVEIEENLVVAAPLPAPVSEGDVLQVRLDVAAVLPELLMRLERDLSGTPTQVLFRSLTVSVLGTETPTLDDVWSGTVTVRLEGAIGATVTSFPAPEAVSAPAEVSPAIDVTGWVSGSPGATLVLSGFEARDMPDSGESPRQASVEVQLDLWGTR